MSWFTAWICGLAALSCAAMPGVGAIQQAYDREEAAGSALHDKGLKVLSAKCHDTGAPSLLCEVSFTSRDDPNQRLYFDIVAIAQSAGGWELRSGLCKR